MVGMVQRNVLPRIPDDPSKTIFENNAMLMELVNEQINRAPYSQTQIKLENSYLKLMRFPEPVSLKVLFQSFIVTYLT